ncbi:hypothetical protein SUGI_0724480 [Cryptomeria japonica]|nr:hypothetical protein SUGI_0724480 [Cryptomeria japonica]
MVGKACAKTQIATEPRCRKERRCFRSQGGDGDERERERNNTNGGSKHLRLQFGGRCSGGDKADGEALGGKHLSQGEEGNEMALRHVREHHYVFTFCHCNMLSFAEEMSSLKSLTLGAPNQIFLGVLCRPAMAALYDQILYTDVMIFWRFQFGQ